VSSFANLDFDRIRRAIERADKHTTIVAMRDFQRRAVGEYVGRHHVQYGDLAGLNGILDGPHIPNALKGMQPDSPLGEMARTYLAHLTADGFTPKAEPRPGQDHLPAQILSARMQVIAEDTGMEERACEFILDAILGVGIQRMRLMDPTMPQPFGSQRYKPGQPYLARVPVDNWIPDPLCGGDLHRAQYVADRYLVDRTMLLEMSPVETRDWIAKLPAFWQTDRCQGVDRSDELFTTDLIELIDIEIQHMGKRYCATMPHYDDNHDGFLIEPYEHFGPEQDSMYVPLALMFSPGSLQPVSPASVLMDAHIAAAALASRAVEEGWTARRKLLYSQEAKQTIAHIMDRRTDMAIPGNPGSVNEITMGGMTEPVVQAYGFATALVNRFGPSVLQAKGVNSGADTATGDTIKAGNANIVFGSWRARRDKALSDVVARVAWYVNALPKQPLQIPIPLPNGQSVVILDDASMTVGEDLASQSLVYKAVTSSKTPMDPRMRQRSISELLGQIIPFVQNVVATGGDPAGAINALADAWEWPELAKIYPTQDAAAFGQAVQQLAQQQSKGADTRQGQMQSDYAPAMAQ